jgi:hypothetical protein
MIGLVPGVIPIAESGDTVVGRTDITPGGLEVVSSTGLEGLIVVTCSDVIDGVAPVSATVAFCGLRIVCWMERTSGRETAVIASVELTDTVDCWIVLRLGSSVTPIAEAEVTETVLTMFEMTVGFTPGPIARAAPGVTSVLTNTSTDAVVSSAVAESVETCVENTKSDPSAVAVD